MFQFQLAMIIQNEHLGHASVNPKVTAINFMRPL
jgi:hypothetical protein